MKQFIDKNYKFCVDIDFSPKIAKTSAKLCAMFNRHAVEKNNQITSGVDGSDFHAIKLTPEKTYDWHFDSCNWYHGEQKIVWQTSHNRYWTHIIYLTEGAPLELGEINLDSKPVVETLWSAPEPKKIIARVYPKPGLGIVFPGFIAHRVHPDIKHDRWCMVQFITTPYYKKFSIDVYEKAKEVYFDEYIRRFGVSP
jgi:hypothetical protein